jgi:hypothetical protein
MTPGDSGTLNIHIWWLREKLDDDPSAPRFTHATSPYYLGGDSLGWLPRSCSSSRFRASPIS